MHWNCQQAKTAGKSACHILAPRMVTFLNNSMADLNQQCKKLLSNLLLERFVILVTWLHTGNPWLLFGTKDYYKLTFWKCGLWLAKSRVSITVWKTWKGSRHYTPSHTPSWTVRRIYALIKKVWVSLEIAWKHSSYIRAHVPTAISRSPKLPRVFLSLKQCFYHWNVIVFLFLK